DLSSQRAAAGDGQRCGGCRSVVGHVDDHDDIGGAEREVGRFDLAAQALNQRSRGAQTLRTAVLEQAFRTLRGIGRLQQVLGHLNLLLEAARYLTAALNYYLPRPQGGLS